MIPELVDLAAFHFKTNLPASGTLVAETEGRKPSFSLGFKQSSPTNPD